MTATTPTTSKAAAPIHITISIMGSLLSCSDHVVRYFFNTSGNARPREVV
jgi:hypothetical protein